MRKLGIVAAVLAALWLVGELVAPALAASQIEKQVARKTEGATTVQADIDSFPMVSRLAATGKISKVTVKLDQIARRRLEFTDFRVTIRGVEVDRRSLFSKPKIRSIDSGRLDAVIRSSILSSAFGFASQLFGDSGAVRVEDGKLIVGSGLASVPIDLPEDLFPCEPDAQVRDDGIALSCTFDEVPESLLDAANGSS